MATLKINVDEVGSGISPLVVEPTEADTQRMIADLLQTPLESPFFPMPFDHKKWNLYSGVLLQAMPEVSLAPVRFPQLESLYFGSEAVQETSSTTEVSANEINKQHLMEMEERFVPELLALVRDEEFEYGYSNRIDEFIREQLALNAMATKECLTRVYNNNQGRPQVLVGILRAIARLDYAEMDPAGTTLAMSALANENVRVKECGVRAFESWGEAKSISVLEHVETDRPWLQEYIGQVVAGLRGDRDAVASAKNR